MDGSTHVTEPTCSLSPVPWTASRGRGSSSTGGEREARPPQGSSPLTGSGMRRSLPGEAATCLPNLVSGLPSPGHPQPPVSSSTRRSGDRAAARYMHCTYETPARDTGAGKVTRRTPREMQGRRLHREGEGGRSQQVAEMQRVQACALMDIASQLPAKERFTVDELEKLIEQDVSLKYYLLKQTCVLPSTWPPPRLYCNISVLLACTALAMPTSTRTPSSRDASRCHQRMRLKGRASAVCSPTLPRMG